MSSPTSPQNYYQTTTLSLQRNSCFCVYWLISEFFLISYYFLIFFALKPFFARNVSFSQMLLNCIFKTIMFFSKKCAIDQKM